MAQHRTRPPRRPATQATARPQFVEVRGPSGRLWCRYDPAAQRLEFIKRNTRGESLTEVVDLTQYRQEEQP